MRPEEKVAAVRSVAAARLLPKFIEHRERDVASIRDALARQDFDAIARLGHNMRGNGRSYGFPELGAIGELLESAADTKNEAMIGEQLTALVAWLAQYHRTPGG